VCVRLLRDHRIRGHWPGLKYHKLEEGTVELEIIATH